MVVLLFLLHGADPRVAKGREPEDGVETLEDLDPAGDSLVADLQVLADRVDGQRGPDELRQAQHEQFDVAQIMHALQAGEFLPNEQGAVLARPAARLELRAAEIGFRKTTQRQQVAQRRDGPQVQFSHGQGVQAQEVVSPLERIAAEAIKVQPPAAGHEDLLPRRPVVEEALEVIPPGPVLVQLIEDPERRRRQLAPQDPLTVFGDVPVEVAGPRVGQAAREGGLADLPGAGNEHHLARQIAADLSMQVAGQRSHEGQDTVIFDLCQKHSRQNSTWDEGWRPGLFRFQIVFQVPRKAGQGQSDRSHTKMNRAAPSVAAQAALAEEVVLRGESGDPGVAVGIRATVDHAPTWLRHPARFSLEPALALGPGPFHTGAGASMFGAKGAIDRMASAFEHRDLEIARATR